MLYLNHLKLLTVKQSNKIKLSITSISEGVRGTYLLNREQRTSLPTKRAARYYQRLYEMAILIIGCSPEYNPINPYKRIENKIKLPGHLPRKSLLQLYQLLLHASVLFNRTHRLRKQRKLITSREDVINSLALIRPVAFPESILLPATLKFYFKLLTIIGKEKEVTRQELSKKLEYHPQKIWRHLLPLIEAGYISIKRRGARGICYYQIVREEET